MKDISMRATLLVLAFSLLAMGCGGGGKHRKGHSEGPPAEAYEACKDKQEGEAVTFDGFRGETVEASCKVIDDKLVAVPNNKSKRERR